MKQLNHSQQELHKALLSLAGEEREIEFKILTLLEEAEKSSLALIMGYKNLTEYCQKELGLSGNKAYKRYQAMRLLRRFPEFRPLLREGKTHVSCLSLISPKVTRENAGSLIVFLPGKSKREVEAFLSTLQPDGSHEEKEQTIEVRLELTLPQLELLKNAQVLLGGTGKPTSLEEVTVKAVDKLLDGIDPLRKAERADERRRKRQETETLLVEKMKASPVGDSLPEQPEESCDGAEKVPAGRYIPQHVRHAVFRRDGNQCTYHGQGGARCTQTLGLEIDHVKPFALGGSHEMDNLRLACSGHNKLMGRQSFGDFWRSPKERSDGGTWELGMENSVPPPAERNRPQSSGLWATPYRGPLEAIHGR